MWNTLIITPLSSTLHYLVSATGDIGVSIILFTIIIKTLLLPLNISANRTTKNIKKIQPEIEKLKIKHKGDNKTLGLELSKLYKEKQIKPFSGILLKCPTAPPNCTVKFSFKIYNNRFFALKTPSNHVATLKPKVMGLACCIKVRPIIIVFRWFFIKKRTS